MFFKLICLKKREKFKLDRPGFPGIYNAGGMPLANGGAEATDCGSSFISVVHRMNYENSITLEHLPSIQQTCLQVASYPVSVASWSGRVHSMERFR